MNAKTPKKENTKKKKEKTDKGQSSSREAPHRPSGDNPRTTDWQTWSPHPEISYGPQSHDYG
jgi:hypothetical protein